MLTAKVVNLEHKWLMAWKHIVRQSCALWTACVFAVSPSSSALAERPIRIDAQGNAIASTVPSFDCAKAQGIAESAICANVGLAWTDRAIDELYKALLRHSLTGSRLLVVEGQRAWLRVRNTCAETTCLANALEAREKLLRQQASEIDRRLRHDLASVGDCEETQIDVIETRLTPVQGEAPNGTQVGFANGVWQVSYDREPNVLASRLGDAVRVCLVEIPQHCPIGDNRGRRYSVENFRTHRRWVLPDSSHECGGA